MSSSGPRNCINGWRTKDSQLPTEESLIFDAGQLVPGWLAAIQGVEFFVHSPWASRTDDGSYVERNDGCLVLHATFEADQARTKVFFGADIRQEPLSDIIRITRAKSRKRASCRIILSSSVHPSSVITAAGTQSSRTLTRLFPFTFSWYFCACSK